MYYVYIMCTRTDTDLLQLSHAAGATGDDLRAESFSSDHKCKLAALK